MSEKAQLNVRVRPNMKEAVGKVCDRLEWTRDELAEVAIATLFGSHDNLIRAKKQKCTEAVRQLKIQLSFNNPTHRLASAFN